MHHTPVNFIYPPGKLLPCTTKKSTQKRADIGWRLWKNRREKREGKRRDVGWVRREINERRTPTVPGLKANKILLMSDTTNRRLTPLRGKPNQKYAALYRRLG